MSYPDNVSIVIPLLLVNDLGVSLKFYIGGLGFEIEDQWVPEGNRIAWCRIVKGGAQLMLQEDKIATSVIKGAGVSIFIICRDALKIYDEAIAPGLEPSEPFVGNRMWVVSFRDPDNYSIEFESSTSEPEGTKWTTMKTRP